MNRIITSLSFFFTGTLLFAQIDQVSVGAGYQQATFYSLSDGATHSVDHSSWDIAFGVGPQDLGVFVNEGVGSGGQEPLPQVELYLSQNTDYSKADTVGMERIYNNEVSWAAGAFNHVADGDDPFDFGWGSYNVSTHAVSGTRVYILKLRDGSYKKLFIESLISGVYTFKYADLDGGNEVTQTVDKSAFPGKSLAYYSFAEQSALDLEPASWDLLFTRYVTPLDDGAGNTLDYLVTGVLINAGLKVATAEGINPQTIDFESYEGVFSDTLTKIGYDWKSFDLSTFQWSLPADRVYFVQTPSDSIWKVQFIDFEGSSTGVTTLEKTFVKALVSSASPLPEHTSGFKLFPNPSRDFIRIALELERVINRNARINIYNQLGQVVSRRSWILQEGSNEIEIPHELEAGLYYLQVAWADDQLTRKFQVN